MKSGITHNMRIDVVVYCIYIRFHYNFVTCYIELLCDLCQVSLYFIFILLYFILFMLSLLSLFSSSHFVL